MFIWHLFQNIRTIRQASHMLAEPEYTINFTLRRILQSVLSVPGQKSSKHTLPLVEDVNSPASQQSPQNKGHYSSQRSTVLSTRLIVARSRISPTCSAFSTPGSVSYQHGLALDAGVLSLCGYSVWLLKAQWNFLYFSKSLCQVHC